MNEPGFEVHRDGERTVVTLSGEIDLACKQALQDLFGPIDGIVVVDLSGVTFLDSTGIGVLIQARNRLLDAGGDLRLRSPGQVPRRTLEITGLTDLIDD